jgi:hypothetical protein
LRQGKAIKGALVAIARFGEQPDILMAKPSPAALVKSRRLARTTPQAHPRDQTSCYHVQRHVEYDTRDLTGNADEEAHIGTQNEKCLHISKNKKEG